MRLTPAGSINARAIRGVRDRQDREPNLQSKPVIMQIVAATVIGVVAAAIPAWRAARVRRNVCS